MCARRVRLAPDFARSAGDRPVFGRRSDRVSFSLVTFSWTSKRKSPRVQGRSHPQIAFHRGHWPLNKKAARVGGFVNIKYKKKFSASRA